MTQDRRITDKLPGHPLQWDDSASPSAAPAAGQAGLAKLCDQLIDIWDDGTRNAPEGRVYVEGALEQVIEEIRAAALAVPLFAPVAADTEQATSPGNINAYCNDLLDCVAALDDAGYPDVQTEMRAAVARIRKSLATPADAGADDQWDRQAEQLTREMGLGGGKINMNATSVLDILVDDDAADAGAGLTEDRIDFIARQYFAESAAQEHAKNAIHDAMQELARLSTPGAPKAPQSAPNDSKAAPAPVTAESAHADDIAWGHDLQLRLMSASQDVTEHDDARQVMAEAACCLAALTGRPVSQSMERAADAAETRDAKGGE